MKVSLIQMNSQADKAANMQSAENLINAAVAADGPDLVSVPEMFTHLDGDKEGKMAAAEPIPGGEAYLMLQGLAKRHGIVVHGGSHLEIADGRCYNTTVAFDRQGNQVAFYRKIHLYDVVLPDGQEFLESSSVGSGRDVVTYEADGITVGCTICYDLRFPELYQALAKKGAKIIMVPAAFQLLTGKDHWEVLLRARAIETETYVLAAGQWGPNSGGTHATYGHSIVIDPWGHVLAKAQDGVGFTTTHLNFDYLESVRAKIPVAQHKVL
jgi:deaminated glutathione amidase